MYNSIDIAYSIIKHEKMTHKKLQKICYYVYCWYLVLNDERLFNSKFQAWIHGPVDPLIYQEFKHNGWENIEYNESKEIKLTIRDERFIISILDIYGIYAADELEKLTHKEQPWKSARLNLPSNVSSNNIISDLDIKEYYGSIEETKRKIIQKIGD